MTDLNITKEELLDLAASKLADAYAEQAELGTQVQRLIERRISDYFDKQVKQRVDDFLSTEMERILNQTINPVDIWGENTGKPTTIKEQLASRARTFWEVKVDSDGRESSYGGESRSTRLIKQVVKDEFDKAIKTNADVILREFKAALHTDAVALVTKHIDNLIRIGR